MSLVAVAISGGVDSLVTAHLLKQAGHRVVGLHFVTGFEPHGTTRTRATHPIHAVGDQLDIAVHTVDLSEAFEESVVDYFTGAYLKGLTPNPCLVCNPRIKFGALFDHARRLGAEALATGHYAQNRVDPSGRHRLYRGVDRRKDQSYFLSRLSPGQLAAAIFPLGKMTKKEVRQTAATSGLSPITADESQDVCFIRNLGYGDFLATRVNDLPGPGPIVDTDGQVIGEHKGLHLYTIGQRRGIDCPAEAPYYVVSIDTRTNRLVVGFRDRLEVSGCSVRDVNWIRRPEGFPAEVEVQIRYRHRPADAVLEPGGGGTVRVNFRHPQSAVTPGQGAAFYHDDELLGGGWILPPIEA